MTVTCQGLSSFLETLQVLNRWRNSRKNPRVNICLNYWMSFYFFLNKLGVIFRRIHEATFEVPSGKSLYYHKILIYLTCDLLSSYFLDTSPESNNLFSITHRGLKTYWIFLLFSSVIVLVYPNVELQTESSCRLNFQQSAIHFPIQIRVNRTTNETERLVANRIQSDLILIKNSF